MDELIKQVAERTGIGEDKARTAVETVLGFLKQRLPAPVAGQLDGALQSGGGQGGALGGIADRAGDALGGLGGMFGDKKE